MDKDCLELKQEVEKELKRIQKELTILYPNEDVTAIIQIMQNNINEYIQCNPLCTKSDLEEYMQTDELLADWIENTSCDHIFNSINEAQIKHKSGKIVVLIAILIIVFFSISISICHSISDKAWNGQMETTVIIK